VKDLMFRQRRCIWFLCICLLLGGCRAAQEKILRIVLIPKGLTHQFWQSILRGAQRAARDLEEKGIKVEIIWDGPLRESDSLAQVRIIDRRVSTEVDGIILAPQHSRTLIAPVKRAVDAGIPVVIIDSGLDEQFGKDLYVKYVATNNENGGYLAAQHLVKVLRDEDKIAEPRLILFRYQIGSESTERREAGFLRYIDEQEKAGKLKVKWLSTDRYAGATRDSAMREAAPLINRFRDDVDGIFAPNESSANGMLDTLRSLDLASGEPANKQRRQVRLMGFDSSEPLLQAIRKGQIEGTIVQDPYKMGYLSVWTMVHHLQGYDVRSDKSETKDPLYLGTGENLITRDNLDDVRTKELFDPAYQEKRVMKAPAYSKKR
jgi:ribose transport system substrate-binding protein